MKYQYAQWSIAGGRKSNQDRTGVAERANGLLMVVADGLGGHAGGELAAETFVNAVLKIYTSVRQPVIQQPSTFLALTVLQGHKAVVAAGHAAKPRLQPRTTCVLCLVQNGYAYWAHVGDSRLYHFRDGALLTRTEDHTTIEELRRDGLISEEEMSSHPRKAFLLKTIGGDKPPPITMGVETLLYRNDVLLLCSDGLWEAFSPEELAAKIGERSMDEAIDDLLLSAERKVGAGCDNISAVCLRWMDTVTKSFPLEPASTPQLDQRALWNAVARKTAVKQTKPPAPIPVASKPAARGARVTKETVEENLRELEDFLKQFDRKGTS